MTQDPKDPNKPKKKRRRRKKKSQPAHLEVSQETPSQEEKRKPGPKTLCTPEMQERLLSIVREDGVTISVAASLCGLVPSTISGWKEKAETGEEPYLTFVKSLREAEASVEQRMSRIVTDFATGNAKKTKVKRKFKVLPSKEERKASWSLGQEWHGWEHVEGSDYSDPENPDLVRVLVEETVEERTEQSLSAALTWLKLQRRERWGDKAQENTGPSGPITIRFEGLPRPGDEVPGEDEDLPEFLQEKEPKDSDDGPEDATGLLMDLD